MAALDGEQIMYTDQNFRQNNENENSLGELQRSQLANICKRFIKEFQSQDVFVYRERLKKNTANETYMLEVEIDDIQSFDIHLYNYVLIKPNDIQVLFEDAIKQCYCEFFGVNYLDSPDFQLQLISGQNPKHLRSLNSTYVKKLVTVTGIIISLTKTVLKAHKLRIQCKNCQDVQDLDLGYGLEGENLPRLCRNRVQANGANGREQCPMDPYVVVPEKSKIIDQQVLRIQDLAESIPTGEVPRNFTVCVDRYLVNQLIPGNRVVLTGIYSVLNNKGQTNQRNATQSELKLNYIHVLGIQKENKRNSDRNFSNQITQTQIEFFKMIAKSNKVYEIIEKSIAPAIFGHEDVKRALACLLFGGSSKTLPDGMKLRGDINILLIGDPSTAKSQLLKFVERISDISIYTSGKGSSAAGLTASINSNGTGSNQFTLEAGALVLASGGVCCIDEFDKMRPEDRVVMHEAMEQQTISIAKAGITTRLNAKCSVLAAANPIFGRYDDSKNISDQIELQTTILSRFDCIFIIRDIRTRENDQRIADHVLSIHTGKFQEMELQGRMEEEATTVQNISLDPEQLKAYIRYAKSLKAPRLDARASEAVVNLYVDDRKKAAEGKGKGHIPITVRQLEAIIRLSEALARMQLKEEVNIMHVQEAHRLFLNSTMQAIAMSYKEIGGGLVPEDMRKLVDDIEASLKRRIPVGGRVGINSIRDDLVKQYQNARAVDICINNLIKNEQFRQADQNRLLVRLK